MIKTIVFKTPPKAPDKSLAIKSKFVFGASPHKRVAIAKRRKAQRRRAFLSNLSAIKPKKTPIIPALKLYEETREPN